MHRVTAAARAALQRRQAAESAMLSRWGEAKLSPSKDRIELLLDLMGSPQQTFRSIHLTGTNGKTSTARMVDELLRAFGVRTGRYTSPHLQSVTERIVLDGRPVSDDVFADSYYELEPLFELVDQRSQIQLTFFEALTAMGYAIFADAPVDVAVVEVGLGGAWDATNVIDAAVAVVTPIDLDHTELLGDTVEQIATEKAGIISPGAIAILAAQPAGAAAELLKRAVAVDATVAREGLEFGVTDRRLAVGGQLLTLQGLAGAYDEVFLPLYGRHQAQNAACALAAVEAFFAAGSTTAALDVDVVRKAFASVRSPGRLETVRTAPTVLVDASHNPAGMKATTETLAEGFAFRQLVGVLAMLAGKDARSVLNLLEPVLDEIVISENASPRTLAADDLAAIAVDVFGADRVTVEPRLDDAIETAIRLAEDNSDNILSGAGVLITGSVVTAGEARTLLQGVAE